jgi:hypothetical protein
VITIPGGKPREDGSFGIVGQQILVITDLVPNGCSARTIGSIDLPLAAC